MPVFARVSADKLISVTYSEAPVLAGSPDLRLAVVHIQENFARFQGSSTVEAVSDPSSGKVR